MGIDLETLLILAVLAFILFGPEKLPEYAAMLGKFVAKMRQATTEMTRQYQNLSSTPEPTCRRPRNPPALLPTGSRSGIYFLPQMRPAPQGRSLPAAAPAPEPVRQPSASSA